MKNPLRPAAAAAALALLAACSGSVPSLPAGANVTCTSSADCPSGTICVTALGRCVAASATDRQAPAIAPGSASVVPAVARAGTVVTVAFQATEELASLPVVRYAGAPTALGTAVRSGSGYTVQFPATTDAGAGPHSLVATLVDLYGNQADAAPVGEVTLDFVAPSAAPPVVTPAFARSGTTLSAVVTLSEAAGATPSLAFDPAPALSASPGPGANQWTFTRVLDGTEPAGAVDLLLTAADAAGNVLSQRFTAAAQVDFTAPQVAAADVTTPVVKAGDTFVAQVRFDEPLGAAPDVRLESGGGASTPVTASAIDALTWSLSYQVPEGAADGDRALRVAASADRSGNAGDPAFLGTVRFDSRAPGVVDLAPDHTNHLYRAGEPMGVSFATDEDLAGVPVVRLETAPLPLDLACVPGAARKWTCTSAALDGTERPESVVNVSVRVADVAGNVAVAPTSVVLDFTRPAVSSAAPGRAAFPAGGTITYVVSVTEPLAAPPDLSVARNGTAVPGFFGAPSSASATTFTWSRAVPAGLDGDYAVSVSLEDEAGNRGGPTPGAGFSVDTVLPSVVGAIAVSPEKGAFRAGDQPSVTFTVSEAIPRPVARLSTATPIDASCSDGPTTFTCTLVRPLAASDLPEGATAMLLTLSDAAGNVGYGSKALVLDYTPPALAGTPAGQLIPGASNLRSSITALGAGSTYRISLIAAEPLSAVPAVVAWDPGLTASIDLTLLSQSGTSYVFELSTGAGVYPAATWTVRWDPVDVAGNRWPSPPWVASLTVDSQPPPAPVTGTAAAPLLLWRRVPWGTSASAASSFTLDGAVGSTSGSADLAVAWDGAAGREVGRAAISGGTFTMALSSDPTDLWLSALDAAGNESARTRVVDVAWTAGLADKVPGSTFENPHRLETRTASLGAVDQLDAVDVGAAALGVSGDGLVVQTGGASFYRPVAGTTSPPVRRYFALAYDAGRGRTVLYGGQVVGGGLPGDTWEWDGNRWEAMAPSDPEGDGNPETWDGYPAFYDPINGGVVLVTHESWLWNGTSWRQLTPYGMQPTGRTNGAVAWDEARGVAVYFGGTPVTVANTYEWDGSAWTDVTPLSTLDSPSPRYHHAMAYDRVRGKVLVFGGMDYSTTYNDVWEWDGAARKWSRLTVAGASAPPPRTDMAVAWDAAAAGSGELVVQGGGLGGGGIDGRTWVMREVFGTPTWVDVTPATTIVGESHAAVYDAGARKVLMLGAWWSGGSVQDGKLRALGAGTVTRSWSLLAPGDPEGDGNPVHTSSNDGAIVWNPYRGVVTYYDDRSRDTWDWNHASWVHGATSATVPSPPSSRSDAALGYYGTSAILFGGTTSGTPVGDTWAWSGAAWSQVDPSPVRTTTLNPLFRQNTGLVTSSSGRLFRFGGSDYTPTTGIRYYSDVYEWTPASTPRWTKIGGGQAATGAWADPQGDGSPGDTVGWEHEVGAATGFVVWDPNRGDTGRMVFYSKSPMRAWEWIPQYSTTVNRNTWIRHDLTSTGSWPSGELALFYDSTLHAPVVVSGALLYGQAWVVDLDANLLREIPLANPLGLPRPDGWVGAFDQDVGRAVIVGDQPYSWESGSATRPAHVLHVDYSRANGPDPGACVIRASCPIQQIAVSWSGGGSGPGGTGASLQGWTGAWTPLTSVAGTPASPGSATWTWTSTSPFPASSLFHGRSRELTFQLVPSSPSTAMGTARVGTDAASVTIRYRRP